MENQSPKDSRKKSVSLRARSYAKLKKKDFVFLGILLLIALVFLLWFLLGYRKAGSSVEITVDGELYGTFSLDEDREVPIRVNGSVTNLLVIADGEANMKEADCPDQICVNHVPVSHTGEDIVCLPNRVVVRVVGEETPELDSVVR